jgi:hypothetical protein
MSASAKRRQTADIEFLNLKIGSFLSKLGQRPQDKSFLKLKLTTKFNRAFVQEAKTAHRMPASPAIAIK